MTQTAAENKPKQISKFIVIIRPEFMTFCEDACRAATFNHLLFRLAGKCKDQPKEDIRAGKVLWYGSNELITKEMSDAWGVCKVRQEINELLNMGLIGRTRNPAWGVDRTKHFFFGSEQCAKFLELCEEHQICVIHLDLKDEIKHLINLSNANDTSITCICGNHQMQVINSLDAFDKSIEAITKNTTKINNKEESISTIPAPPPSGADAPHTRSSSISEKESGSQQQAPTQENQQPVTVRKDAAEKKPARAKKPALDEVTQKRVDAVYEALDEFKQKVLGPDARYRRTVQKDIDAIVLLLELNPTKRKLLLVCKNMWEDKDRNGEYFWRKHMKPHNICSEYESRIMALEGKDRIEVKDPEQPRTTVSGYQDYTPAPGAPLQTFRPLARVRR